jgi:hypothetical protein
VFSEVSHGRSLCVSTSVKDIEGILWVLESLGVPNKKSRRN